MFKSLISVSAWLGLALASRPAVVLYELPQYLGQSVAVISSDDAASTLAQWKRPIFSIVVDPAIEFVTYDDAGNSAVWHHSTSLLGNWPYKISSFKVQPATANTTTNTSSIQAPWSYIGSGEGYLMVRNSSSSAGQPECYSNDGVNCVTATSVADLLTVPTKLDVALYPAQCGADRFMHWGSTGYESVSAWCYLAREALATAPLPWECVQGSNGWVALAPNNSLCVSTGARGCVQFASQATCTASTTMLAGPITAAWTFACGNLSACVGSSSSTGSGTGYPFWTANTGSASWSIACVGAALALCGVFAIFSRSTTPAAVNVEATYCSSVGDAETDDDLESVYRTPV
ncbi:hypothetical protein SDRG_00035 [Saprolegnia diclina VS20]|uniref:Uncharacterized protein n=1 Tax=Saprolegnia diclina (strain VS20) TaxID=1156394 RepID=T0R5T0_SAPDV|nr:hypothetical protein SDRG_00035 [Saprolegnia diclina VS20]EQC42296.1 hypothetical protein SDRG_00035 [Saprolegnia diclina VS20]|eukprot:XP_008603719.1 hypothetical protein SDRG_00035 [Saprolegnia diclina VS20]